MKKTRRLLMLFLACMYSVVIMPHAMAGQVLYTEDGGQIIFISNSEYIKTDLFTDFKDVMPGDRLSQIIRLDNQASEAVDVNVYLRSQGVQAGSADFLHQLWLQVKTPDDLVIFDAPADETAQLTEWLHLGEVHPGEVMDLNLTLEVPTSMGNAYQNQIGCVVWEFWILETPAEDAPVDPDLPGTGGEIEPEDPEQPGWWVPVTGDTSNIWLFVGLFGGSGVLLMLLILLYFRRRKEEEEN